MLGRQPPALRRSSAGPLAAGARGVLWLKRETAALAPWNFSRICACLCISQQEQVACPVLQGFLCESPSEDEDGCGLQ